MKTIAFYRKRAEDAEALIKPISDAEMAKRKAEIQKTWTPRVEAMRRGDKPPNEWEPPIVGDDTIAAAMREEFD